MDELSEVWYSGLHRRPITRSSHQLKTAIAITVLILCGLLMVIVGITLNSLHMKTGGYTMCSFGMIAAVCLFWLRYYFKRANASDGTMQRHDSSLTHSVELTELMLRERQTDEPQNSNLSASRREVNFLLARMIGYPPSYEEVATSDANDARTQAHSSPPPCYTDEEMAEDANNSPPSYESVTQGILTSEA